MQPDGVCRQEQPTNAGQRSYGCRPSRVGSFVFARNTTPVCVYLLRMSKRELVLIVVCGWAMSVTPSSTLAHQSDREHEHSESPTISEEAARAEIDTLRTALLDRPDFALKAIEFRKVADQLILSHDSKPSETFLAADALRRVCEHLATLERADTDVIYPILHRNTRLARTMAYMVGPGDDVAAAYRMLARLVARFDEETIANAADLAVAVCVVHDRPYARRVNENRTRGVSGELIFEYFLQSATKLQMDPRQMPAEMLVYVVSVAEPLEELSWAWSTYRRQTDHDQRYFEIQYDRDHFLLGVPKKVTQSGDYRLRNIKQFGGVCVDQAYFAEHVAKANGVPAVLVTGRAAEVGHAWLGFYRADRRQSRWDFDAGCYEDYRSIRGIAREPRTNSIITQGEIDMIASASKLSRENRWTATALVEVEDRLRTYSPAYILGCSVPILDIPKRRLELLELAARSNPSDASVWRAFARLAVEGHASDEDIERWLVAFDRQRGRSLDVLAEILDMVATPIEDADRRVRLWEWGIKRFQGRSDLQAFARERQAAAFRESGDLKNAWRAYEDVSARFVNAGPFAVDAVLAKAEMLHAERGGQGVAVLLQQAWGRTEKPSSQALEFFSRSNWYRLGQAYAEELTRLNRHDEARLVAEELHGGKSNASGRR